MRRHHRRLLVWNKYNYFGCGGGVESVATVTTRLLEELEQARRDTHQTRSLSTGIAPLDALTTGLRLRELTVIAGRPGVGKSTLAFQIGLDIARTGQGVLIVSREMSAEQVIAKEVSRQALVHGDRFVAGMSPLELESVEEHAARIRALPVWIDTEVNAVEHIQQRLAREPTIHLVIVDYVQLLRGTQRDVRHQEISDVAYGLHDLCLKGYTVLAVSQMNRNIEYRDQKEPKLSDLDGSDGVGKAAENVWMLTQGDEQETGRMVDIHIVKSRYGQAQRTVRVWFQGQYSRFSALA